MIGEFKGLCDAAMMIVKTLLPRAEFACHDAADALALAIYYGLHSDSLSHCLRGTA
ncbi:hypothetical protein [Bartonella machadoae]|uniref:hypothetical protein n=1 Tax=Bartonella machadoae TaxID=2893471 RepID=UPI001F4D2A50|nr:hypothetical protein [Bartonella machadoae]UNE53996.1 hypothetical protein LNM86_10580 [Bartonella machadoae]